MDYVCPVIDLEQRLKEAGEQLAFPPSSTNDLLDLLDKTEELLTFVGQEPSISMQGALVLSMGALITDGLIKHSEIDVRVSVASCLCEVARITAPDPPYKDGIMKEIFQLIVLAFGQLSNETSHSYHKAVHILESVAKVKTCLLMLDLECDALVLEMFEQLLNENRVNHPDTVFSDMETIMTLIIQESDKIATELLSLLISHVKKENQIVSPASWKVAETVLRNCNDTLKSYSETIMKLISSNPDDYAEVVTLLCQNTHEDDHVATRSTRSNGTRKRDLNTLENGGSMKKQKLVDKNQVKGKELETPKRGRPKKNKDSLNQENGPNVVQYSQNDMRRTRFQGKKQSNSKGNIKNPGSLYNVVIKQEDDIISDNGGEEPLMQQAHNNKVQSRRKSSSNKRSANDSDNGGAEPLVLQAHNNTVQSRRKSSSNKRSANGSDNGGAEPLVQQAHNNNVQSRRKSSFSKPSANGSDNGGAEPLTQQTHNNEIQSRRKSSSSKRSRGKDVPKKLGQDLVGHRIKVWWPLDKMYYEGAVSSYNRLDDKYMVLYADGDEELLDLHLEKWMMLDEISPDQEQAADLQSPMTTPAQRPKQRGRKKLKSTIKQEDNSDSPKSPLPTNSSKAMDVICKNKKKNPVSMPDNSRGFIFTERATADMEKNGDPNMNGELQATKLSQTSKMKAQKLNL